MPIRADDPNIWKPPADKSDQECTLLELWSRYHKEIAYDRNFMQPDNTIRDYTSTLFVIQEALKRKPAVKMDPYDCWEAIRSVLYRTFKNEKKPYAATTLQKRLTVIKDIFIYAEKCAICFNPLWMPPWELICDVPNKQVDFNLSVIDIKEKIQNINRGKNLKEKCCLTQAQEYELMGQISNHVLEDGRWVGMLTYLSLGVRPSEGRGITFGSISPLSCDPSRCYVHVLGTADQQGNRQDRMKNKYSYRSLPVPLEMQALISKRKELIKTSFNKSDDDIADFPLICKENNFDVPCTDAEMAVFARKVLTDIVSPDVLSNMLIAEYGEELESHKKEDVSPNYLTAYALRHNFCTKLYSETQLSDEEIRLIMGHSTETSLRNAYSDRRVYEMMEKMDHRMIDPNLHPGWSTVLKKGSRFDINNSGTHYLTIPADQTVKGVKIKISAESMAAGDALFFLLKQKLPSDAHISYSSYTTPYEEFRKQSVNTDYDHWNLPEW